MCMILAGKCGSSIASEIGSMRTEQLDAMDIMGVNAANFVILPKVIGRGCCLCQFWYLSVCL